MIRPPLPDAGFIHVVLHLKSASSWSFAGMWLWRLAKIMLPIIQITGVAYVAIFRAIGQQATRKRREEALG
jgi:hypothetical protein